MKLGLEHKILEIGNFVPKTIKQSLRFLNLLGNEFPKSLKSQGFNSLFGGYYGMSKRI